MSFGVQFGQLVKRCRGIEGFTQEQLADKAGISKTRISELENGRVSSPQVKTVDALVVALNIKQDDLDNCRSERPTSPTLRTGQEGSPQLHESGAGVSNSLSAEAANLGRWIAESSNDGGRFDVIGYEETVNNFSNLSDNVLLEAVGELEIDNLVIVSPCFEKPFNRLCPTHRLFELFDPQIFSEAHPRRDAAKIARELLSSQDGVSAGELAQKFGWSHRRINPALAIVGEFIADGRKSSPHGQPFVIMSMYAAPDERAMLRRFVNNLGDG